MSHSVAEGYNLVAKEGQTKAQRENSRTNHLRFFNNWIKSYLYQKYCPENPVIFDCACGKGGDIPKQAQKNPRYVAYGDISNDSFTNEKSGLISRLKGQWPANFYVGDIFGSKTLLKRFNSIQFDLCSCQFALHYAFDTIDHARTAISNLCGNLIPRGYVILTIPNACRISRQFMNAGENRRIENSLFYMEREFELTEIPPFGAQYKFFLTESVLELDEYLVHPQILISLFKDNNCDLVETSPFHEFYHNSITTHNEAMELFAKLIQINKQKTDIVQMTQDEWDIISLYSFYVFQKRGNPVPNQTIVPKDNQLYTI